MTTIDRSRIPELHAAARRARAEYVGCLARRLATWVGRFLQGRPQPHTASCG